MKPIKLILALCLLISTGCHNDKRLQKGNLDALLSGEQEEVNLEKRSLMVEEVATELPPDEPEPYRIGINDRLYIRVAGFEDLSSNVNNNWNYDQAIAGSVVEDDGTISLPGLPNIPVAGQTLPEFQKNFGTALAKIVKNPQYSVSILQYNSQKFFVLGAVNSPGTFVSNGRTTLLEALGQARGVRDDANLANAYVIRNRKLLPINLDDLLNKGNTALNIIMKKDDLVYLPAGVDQKVYVLGEVRAPQAMQLYNGRLTLIQAISQAGGLLPVTAKKNHIKLIRGTLQNPTVYTLDYDTILAYGDTINLRAGDRVVVQPTGLTTMSRYMELLMPFLNGFRALTGGHADMKPYNK